MYTVTRQSQWPDGTPIVEVSSGGIDYCNPDALVERYSGEMQEYEDPREAVKVAIAICEAWRRDGEEQATIGYGNTLGMTMPFESCEYDEARRWAKREYERLDKCSMCGRIVSEPAYLLIDDDESRYCSEFCADKAAYELL